MKISDVAALAGCSVRAIRHMHSSGVIAEPARLSNGYRDYSIPNIATIVRARSLIDAGVPLSRINEPDATEQALSLIDDQLAHLELQRAKLLALQAHPQGMPEDIRRILVELMSESEWLRHELDSFDLMAFAGVATPSTWETLRQNLSDPACVQASREAFSIWARLGEPSSEQEVRMLVDKLLALVPNGYMKDVASTLRPGTLPLDSSDVPLHGAQHVAFRKAISAFSE